MTTHEIQTKLLAYYKEKLEGLPEEDWREYIAEHKVHIGMCFCLLHHFKIQEGYDQHWMEGIKFGGYPVHADDRNEAIRRITTRISILTSLTSAQPNK